MKFRNIFSNTLGIAASICSILSVAILVFSDPSKAIIALISFIVFLLVVLFEIHRFLSRSFASKYPDGYSKQSTFIRYTTSDARQIQYEVFKHIQCKSTVMEKFSHGFKWSGSKIPKIESHMQNRVEIVTSTISGQLDILNLFFKTPLRYNECGVIHILMNIDDTDQASKTHIAAKVEDNIELICMRVELGNKPNDYDKNAILSKKLLKSEFPQEYTQFDVVSFDRVSKSYEYYLKNPDVGFVYKLAWER